MKVLIDMNLSPRWIRGVDLQPSTIGVSVIRAFHQMELELESGALVTIDPKRTRLRVLPLFPREN